MKCFTLLFVACALLPLSLPAAPGDVELAFNANVSPTGVDGAHTFSLQPDGRILSGGSFKTVGGVAREHLVRLNADAAMDASFIPVINDAVQVSTLQPDGKIIVAGIFTSVNGVTKNRVARLNADGSLDTGFTASSPAEVRVIQLLPDGNILIGGSFTTFNGSSRTYLAKVTATGTLVSGFNPVLNARVRTAALQPDGKILVGGDFSTVSGSTRNRLVRLNADGTVDTGFNAAVTGSGVYSILVQPDGRIVIGGSFTAAGGQTRSNVARLSAVGGADASFNPAADDIVRAVTLQTDGKLIFTGNFATIGGASRGRIARTHSSGALDAGFNAGADDIVFGATIQADGKILVAGEFLTVSGIPRTYFVRLENDEATQSLTVPLPSRIQWLRGGASPETHEVTFEVTSNGGASWQPLGKGTRIAGGWELTGIELPSTGQVRARARIYGAYGNASSGLVETVSAYSFTALQLWRQTNFGTMTGSGSAADNADPDNDGLENLVEFAFALNPNAPDSAALPAWQRDDDNYILTFTRPANVSGITYVAECSSSLTSGSWSAAANTGTGNNVIFVATATGPRLYLRVRITAP